MAVRLELTLFLSCAPSLVVMSAFSIVSLNVAKVVDLGLGLVQQVMWCTTMMTFRRLDVQGRMGVLGSDELRVS